MIDKEGSEFLPTDNRKNMNWLQKIASVQIYFHGASIQNLKSILSEGLNTQHEATFTEDFRGHDRSIETYGGIYLTTNLMTAISGAGNANEKRKLTPRDDRVVVGCLIENRTPSGLVDEDSMYDPSVGISSYFNISPNGWYLAHWALDQYPDIEGVAKEYIRHIFYAFKFDDPTGKVTENFITHAIPVIKKWTEREIAIYMNEDSWNRHKEEFKSFLDFNVQQKNQEYRQAMDQFIHKAHRLSAFAEDRGGFRDNIRMTEPITYRGRNRIQAVFVIKDNPDYFEETGKPQGYYNTVNIVYLGPKAELVISEFIEQFKQRVGNKFLARDMNEKIYYDNPSNEVYKR